MSAVTSGKNHEVDFDSHARRTAHATTALRRFRAAVSASVLQDEDTPAHVRSTETSGKIIAQRGPYLLSGNWWDEKSWRRAEWDLQLQNGELIRLQERDGVWKIDGVYD
jgi:protein ImuB